jgi:hypothetical protein
LGHIEGYAGKLRMTPVKACMHVLDETEKVLGLILRGAEGEGTTLDACAA